MRSGWNSTARMPRLVVRPLVLPYEHAPTPPPSRWSAFITLPTVANTSFGAASVMLCCSPPASSCTLSQSRFLRPLEYNNHRAFMSPESGLKPNTCMWLNAGSKVRSFDGDIKSNLKIMPLEVETACDASSSCALRRLRDAVVFPSCIIEHTLTAVCVLPH